MAASLTYCRYCPVGKKDNKRTSKRERRSYHKLLRRLNKLFVKTSLTELYQ